MTVGTPGIRAFFFCFPPSTVFVLPFFFLFLSFLPFLFFSSFSFLFPFPIGLFDFLQVRGSFISLYYSFCHVSPFPWSMCYTNTCSRWHSPHHLALMPCVILPWCHVATPGHGHHPMCHPTPGASKNVKFRPSRNSTKFDWITRFREKNSMVKFASSSEI